MKHPVSSTTKGNQNKPPGCFGYGWCAFSSIFVFVGLWITLQELKLWTYQEVPCQVQEFKILVDRNNDEPFSAEVRFNYQHEGADYTGNRLSSNDSRDADYEHFVKVEQEVQSRGTCYLDPKKPEEAVLKRSQGTVWGGLAFTLFGGFFVAIGVFIIKASKAEDKALSAKGSSKKMNEGGPIAFAFFGIFAAVGLGLFVGLVIPTARKFIAAQTWEATPATVIWSTVRSHSSDDGTTYSPDIFYRYQFESQNHRSNSFSLMSGSSSGYDGKQRIVADYPTGKEFTCYVNPGKPWQAVVQRKLGWWALFGLFPLPFLAVGLGGIWWALKQRGKPAKSHKSARLPERKSHLPERTSAHPEPQKLKPKNRVGAFFGHLFFALFWCGIVSVFVVVAWGKWAKGEPEWFLNIFLIPFVLIGLAAVLSLPYSFLAIFSPHFDMSIKDGDLRPGTATKFRWKKSKGSGHLTGMTVTLVGQEEATYRRGTDSTTATSIFYQKEIFKTRNLTEILQNECDLIFPNDALPSLTGSNNKIRWFLRLHADVKSRPDVKEQIDLTLQPLTESDFR